MDRPAFRRHISSPAVFAGAVLSPYRCCSGRRRPFSRPRILRAKYVAFKTADDYPSSIDMATALHPQTLLATAYGGDTLADPFGYPVRLRRATKLGYKNPKWITAI